MTRLTVIRGCASVAPGIAQPAEVAPQPHYSPNRLAHAQAHRFTLPFRLKGDHDRIKRIRDLKQKLPKLVYLSLGLLVPHSRECVREAGGQNRANLVAVR